MYHYRNSGFQKEWLRWTGVWVLTHNVQSTEIIFGGDCVSMSVCMPCLLISSWKKRFPTKSGSPTEQSALKLLPMSLQMLCCLFENCILSQSFQFPGVPKEPSITERVIPPPFAVDTHTHTHTHIQAHTHTCKHTRMHTHSMTPLVRPQRGQVQGATYLPPGKSFFFVCGVNATALLAQSCICVFERTRNPLKTRATLFSANCHRSAEF